MIHGVDLAQVIQDEEQDSSLLTAWSVLVTCLINLLHGLFGGLKNFFDINLCLLGDIQGVNKLHVFKNELWLDIEQKLENLILEFTKFLVVLFDLLNLLTTLGLNLWLFRSDDNL